MKARFRTRLLVLGAIFFISTTARAAGVFYFLKCAGSLLTFSWLRAPHFQVALDEMGLSKTAFLSGDFQSAFKILRSPKFYQRLGVEYEELVGPQLISDYTTTDPKTLGGFGLQLILQMGLQTHCSYDHELEKVQIKLPPDLLKLMEGKPNSIDFNNPLHALLVKNSYLSLVEEYLHAIEMKNDVTISPLAATFFVSSYGKGITGVEAMEADVMGWMLENGLISLVNPDILDRAFLVQRYRSRRQLLRYLISLGRAFVETYPELKNYEIHD